MIGRITEIPRTHNPFAQSGVQPDSHGVLHYRELPGSLIAMLRPHADRRPDTEAVVEVGGARLTYAALWQRAARVAGGLRARGVEPGDRVALRYPAGVDWVVGFWGIVFAGAIAVVVNTRGTAADVEFVLADAEVSVDMAPGQPLPDGPASVSESASPTDVAALFYTSGTTGLPKGVPTTHAAFVTNTENMIRCLGLAHAELATLRTLISVPLFHVTGCNSQLLVAARTGGAAVILPALDLPTLMNTLSAERISLLVTVPAVYALLLRHPGFATADCSTVTGVAYGGAPIAPALVRALRAGFPQATLMNGYGMTETASLLTVLPDADADHHADSVGYAVPSVDLGVLPIGADPQVGELVARGANVTAEYWKRPAETAKTMIDGWLRTGDIVRVDAAGRVHLIDRSKDIINRGGENISSVEVEAALLGAPGVLDAAALAVPDEVMGEKVGAVLVLGSDEVDIDAVVGHCREHLAEFKVPQYVSVMSGPLPRNSGGKLLKTQLRDQVDWTPL